MKKTMESIKHIFRPTQQPAYTARTPISVNPMNTVPTTTPSATATTTTTTTTTIPPIYSTPSYTPYQTDYPSSTRPPANPTQNPYLPTQRIEGEGEEVRYRSANEYIPDGNRYYNTFKDMKTPVKHVHFSDKPLGVYEQQRPPY